MAQHVTSQDQMHLVDEHGNGVHEGTPMGSTPTTGTVTHDDAMKKGHEHQHEGQQQLHRRSGSSSSSSSEDDGEGGRRKKKGIKEKIKDKLTGDTTHHDDNKELTDHQQPPQTTTTTTPCAETEGEDKGMMDKIKEKIPGMH
ncbi:abscisic acid and environmental stress-inducible protein TAS14-like [Lycium ferocissimum]|uniref:abscisic acid and environmental stress-inducible protein TAS14-like n=1 Tax=Lycium ferocissimum TaxID=112874 RepID=UPI002814DEFE|nr:abscisic acid and environmental stress-inducible protein TAS14-like [Lycium ferocissimum]